MSIKLCDQYKKKHKKGDLGKTDNIVKDFLIEDSDTLPITRGVNNIRRKCEVIYKEKVGTTTLANLQKGSSGDYRACISI